MDKVNKKLHCYCNVYATISRNQVKALKIKKSDHTKPKTKNSRAEKIPFYIFMSAIGFVLISFVFIYLVDLRNVFGSRDLLYSLDPKAFHFRYRPFLFYHLFGEAKTAEILQWILLGGASLVAMFIAGIMHKRDRTAFLFWSIMAVAFTLMLIEDAGNPRHTMRSYVQAIFSEEERGLLGTAAEGVYFTLLAAIPIYALLHYRKPVMADRQTTRYLITGFVGYGLAASLSLFGTGIGIYLWAGNKLKSGLLLLADEQAGLNWSQYEQAVSGPFFDIMLMDWVVEESIELMAAAAFCASAVAFLLYVRKAYRL